MERPSILKPFTEPSSGHLWIGIDPGKLTGLSLWDQSGKRFVIVSSFSFWPAIKVLNHLVIERYPGRITIVVEDPNQIKGLYNRHQHEARKNLQKYTATITGIAQRVGKNKRDAQLIIDWCQENGVRYIAVKPTGSKWDSSTFKSLTKWTGRTNEHSRDAGRLVFGR